MGTRSVPRFLPCVLSQEATDNIAGWQQTQESPSQHCGLRHIDPLRRRRRRDSLNLLEMWSHRGGDRLGKAAYKNV